jgi:hypothetical protein
MLLVRTREEDRAPHSSAVILRSELEYCGQKLYKP